MDVSMRDLTSSEYRAATIGVSLCPAQNISADVLYRIFDLTLPVVLSTILSRNNTPLDIYRIEPMNFSVVCRSWRAAILSHPSLWSCFHIAQTTLKPIHPLVSRIYSRWLQYSRTSLLSISLSFFFASSGDNTELRHMIDATLCHWSRIKHAKIRLYNAPRDYTISFPFSSALNSLLVEVCNEYQIAPLDCKSSLDFTPCSTNSELRRLETNGEVRWSLPKYPNGNLHFPNLTDLVFCTDVVGDLGDVRLILSACPNVEIMSISARRCMHSFAGTNSAHLSCTDDPAFLQCLENLSISSCNRAVTLQLVKWMTCPSLRYFSVKAKQHDQDSKDPDDHCMTRQLLFEYSKFVARSRPPLTCLKLEYSSPPLLSDGHGPLVREMLRPLRSLKTLALSGVAVDTEVFEEITRLKHEETQSSSSICPLLSKLEITYRDPRVLSFRISPGAVEAMIESRRTPPHELKDCKLRLPGSSEGELSEILICSHGIYA